MVALQIPEVKPLQAILYLEEAKCSEFELLILRTETTTPIYIYIYLFFLNIYISV